MEDLNKEKLWGGTLVARSLFYLGYLRLRYCLEDLAAYKGKLVDVGCGAGGFAKSLKTERRDLDIYGIDINERAIKFAQKNAQGVHFIVGDITQLPFKNKSLDIVVVMDVFEHLEDPEAAFSEIARVLKSGGIAHLFIPLEGEWYTLHALLYSFGWRAKEKLAGHIQQLTRHRITQMLQEKGFSVRKTRYSGHFLGQVIDVLYYTLLQRLGRNLPVGLEQHLLKENVLLRLGKNMLAFLMNIESCLLWFLPGSGIHVLIRKQDKK